MIEGKKIIFLILLCVQISLNAASVTAQDDRELRVAASFGDAKRVEQLLAKGAHPNAMGDSRQTALTLAGKNYIIKTSVKLYGEMVAEAPEKLNLLDIKPAEQTIEYLLAKGARIEDLEELIKNDPYRADNLKKFVDKLKIKIQNKTLAQAQAKELTQEDKERALRFAAGASNVEKIKELIEQKVNPNAASKKTGETPLGIIGDKYIKMSQNTEMDPGALEARRAEQAAELLIDAGADIKQLEKLTDEKKSSYGLFNNMVERLKKKVHKSESSTALSAAPGGLAE